MKLYYLQEVYYLQKVDKYKKLLTAEKWKQESRKSRMKSSYDFFRCGDTSWIRTVNKYTRIQTTHTTIWNIAVALQYIFNWGYLSRLQLLFTELYCKILLFLFHTVLHSPDWDWTVLMWFSRGSFSLSVSVVIIMTRLCWWGMLLATQFANIQVSPKLVSRKFFPSIYNICWCFG